MKIRKSRVALLLVILLLISALIGAAIMKYMPNFTKTDYRTALDLGDRAYFVFQDALLKDMPQPIKQNDVLYIPVDLVKDRIDKYIFWDEKANRLSITTENKVIRMSTDSLDYYINDKPMALNLPVYQIDGQAYLPQSFVEDFYNVEISYDEHTNLAVIDPKDEALSTALIISKKSNARLAPNIKAPILKTLTADEQIVIFGELDRSSQFTRARLADGSFAHVPTKSIGDVTQLPPTPKESEPVSRPSKALDGKIFLLWDQVFRVEANSDPSRRIIHAGLSVLSPTWFSFAEPTDGKNVNVDIVNIADKSYVDWAHSNGYQVWALLSDNFNSKINHAVLSDTANREYVIKQLLALTALYELDGINIDFEALRTEDAEYYIQFIRELGPLLHEQGAILSVDMFVPTYTKYYNRTEIGKAADYICVMTYDEHWSGSETSGPVASLPFVDKGIADTLTEVPKEKILLGLPFYARVWREELVDGKMTHTIKNYDMETAYNTFIENGASFTWLPDIGSYYGEYKKQENGKEITYKVWLEDMKSIQEKLKIATAHDVAGVAGWKRGLEADGVFDAINGWK